MSESVKDGTLGAAKRVLGLGGRMPHLGRTRYLVAVIGVVAGLVASQGPAAADSFSDPGFATERVATVPPYTLVGMAFAPDGRIFVWQKNGIVRVIKNGQLLPTPFIDLSAKVNTYDDRGFWGLAFDPQFASNGRVYMSYTFENAGDPNSSGPSNGPPRPGHGRSGESGRGPAAQRAGDPREHRNPTVHRLPRRLRLHRVRRWFAHARVASLRERRDSLRRCRDGSDGGS